MVSRKPGVTDTRSLFIVLFVSLACPLVITVEGGTWTWYEIDRNIMILSVHLLNTFRQMISHETLQAISTFQVLARFLILHPKILISLIHISICLIPSGLRHCRGHRIISMGEHVHTFSDQLSKWPSFPYISIFSKLNSLCHVQTVWTNRYIPCYFICLEALITSTIAYLHCRSTHYILKYSHTCSSRHCQLHCIFPHSCRVCSNKQLCLCHTLETSR